MFGGEVRGGAFGFAIGNQVDAALAPQLHRLGAVIGNMGKAHAREHWFEQTRFGRGELDELEAVQAKRVFEQIVHGILAAGLCNCRLR